MNKNLFKWLEALRSGQYQQGRGTMCKVNQDGETIHCCLGVLADIVKDDLNLKWDISHPQIRTLRDKYIAPLQCSNTNMPPLSVIDTIPGLGPRTQDKVCSAELVRMNDSQGKTFAEIADYLEEKLG